MDKAIEDIQNVILNFLKRFIPSKYEDTKNVPIKQIDTKIAKPSNKLTESNTYADINLPLPAFVLISEVMYAK